MALVAHVAKHNVECVFIHSMLSFDQKRRLFVDRWFFLFHRVCTIPVGIFMYILVMYLQIKSFNIYVHARWNERNLFYAWVIRWFQLKNHRQMDMEYFYKLIPLSLSRFLCKFLFCSFDEFICCDLHDEYDDKKHIFKRV